MAIGSKYLMRSAELSGLEELEEEIQKEKEAKKAAKKAAKLAKKGIVESAQEQQSEELCSEADTTSEVQQEATVDSVDSTAKENASEQNADNTKNKTISRRLKCRNNAKHNSANACLIKLLLYLLGITVKQIYSGKKSTNKTYRGEKQYRFPVFFYKIVYHTSHLLLIHIKLYTYIIHIITRKVNISLVEPEIYIKSAPTSVSADIMS